MEVASGENVSAVMEDEAVVEVRLMVRTASPVLMSNSTMLPSVVPTATRLNRSDDDECDEDLRLLRLCFLSLGNASTVYFR